MKHLLFLIAIAGLALTSCTQETLTNTDPQSDNLYESFMIKRNADGTYALNHEVTEGVASDYSTDNGVNEIYLYKDGNAKKMNNTKEYAVENNNLRFIFTDENNNRLPKVNIFDNNTKDHAIGLLKTYNVVDQNDETVTVNFTVEKGVQVVFKYNAEEKANEIHLSQGNNNQTEYTKKYTKNDKELKVDFIQETTKDNTIKKPRVIISA